jgi:hypothetical protein
MFDTGFPLERRRRQNMARATIDMTATPPTTPPAIGPAFDLVVEWDGAEGVVGVLVDNIADIEEGEADVKVTVAGSKLVPTDNGPAV